MATADEYRVAEGRPRHARVERTWLAALPPATRMFGERERVLPPMRSRAGEGGRERLPGPWGTTGPSAGVALKPQRRRLEPLG